MHVYECFAEVPRGHRNSHRDVIVMWPLQKAHIRLLAIEESGARSTRFSGNPLQPRAQQGLHTGGFLLTFLFTSDMARTPNPH